jgi:anthranilate synthase component 2
MILMIDNYDSFTYNIVQYLYELGQEVKVYKHDEITLQEIEILNPNHLVISPGPRSPNEAGISLPAINHFAGKIPILGVCLGHQAIGQAFGGEIISAKTIMHGKTSMIHHDETGLFKNIPNPYSVIRYHSLAINPDHIPDCLTVTATTDDGEIMAVQHKTLPIAGVQFHPESILSEYGHQLLQNFLTEIH